jgi:hypothetical protein
MWNYFAGSIAGQLAKSGISGMAAQAADYYRAATSAVPTLSWLYEVGDAVDHAVEGAVSIPDSLQLDGIEKSLLSLGVMHSRKYDKVEADIRAGIQNDDQFEQSHRLLGELLGFSAGKVESSGSPDPWWRLGSLRIWVFEDHAGAKESSKLSVNKARQAATHENWIRANLPDAATVPVTKVLITPVTHADPGAKCHLHDVKLWSLADFRSWVEGALSALRELRKTLGEAGDLEWRASAIALLRERRLTGDLMTKNLPTGEQALHE